MFSADVKLVFGFEPSGLFERVIFAPLIGMPRTLLFAAGDDELEFGFAGESELFGCDDVSVFVIFGTFILGILNCAVAGTAAHEAVTIAAISVRENLRMVCSPIGLRLGFSIKLSIGDKFYTIGVRLW
jgi:hypothetical protein